MVQCPNIPIYSLFILFIGLFHFLNPIFGLNERQRVFRVPESLASGQHIGFVRGENGEPLEAQEKQNFFIVFPPEGNGIAERIIQVNERTGEISVRSDQNLDREAANKIQILAIPVDGNEPIEIRIEILDENDNAPTFPVDSIRVEISEYARINTEMSLPKAKDADEGKYGIQKYRIASGNVNNAFRLSYNGELFLDLVVNGQLDREYRAKYELLVEAIDGGKPPKIGKLRVEVDVLDANDNPPEFIQSHYSTRIGPNIGPGIPILRVTAKDQDEGENGQIEYSIASQSIIGQHQQILAPSSIPPQIQMQIDPKSGAISLQNPLPPNLSGPIIFELVICAKDKGIPNPLEATATVQIVIEGNENEKSSTMGIHRIGLIWLTEDGTPENVPEGLPLGQVLARASVEGDSEGELDELKLSLLGGQSAICLRQTDSGNIYLLVICGQLDYEKMAVFQMDLLLRKGIGGDVLVDLPIHLTLKDLNDNSPIWNSTNFQFEWKLGEDGTEEGRRLLAKDEDSGENGRIEYKLVGTDLFRIDKETGELWLRNEKQLPFCQSDGGKKIQFQVEATDHGNPPLSARTNVSILLMPIYSNESSRIHFGQSLYELTISEDIRPGTCIFQISAVDNAICPGQNASNLHYWLSEGEFSGFFKLESKTGILCTKQWLDIERDGNIIELEAMAGNGDGPEANSQLLIRLEGVNDNSPIFHPREYALLLSPDGLDPSKTLLRVRAIDKDQSAKFNQINFEMGQGIGAELFQIDRQNGELKLTELGAKKLGMVEEGQIGMYGMELRVEAKDSGGRRSEEMAIIRVRLLPAHFHCMSFSERIFRFKVSEETLPGIGIGQLRVEEVADPEKVKFEIVREEGMEGNGLFGFDEMRPNQLILEEELDADVAGGDEYLLNIKAIDGTKNCTNYTQILVQILDTNDNGPKFGAKKVRIELAEDQPIHVPFYAIKAMDKDRGEENGRISYELVGIRPNNSLLPILVHPQTGAISLSAQLDVDLGGNGQHFWIGLRAFDHGMPARKAEIELELVVLDVNDNGPKFVEEEYSIEVYENAEIGQILLRVEAKDADKSVENSRIQYGISQIRPEINEEDEPILGINARNGEIFLRHNVDREKCKEYLFELNAMDGGNPPRNGTAKLRIGILDLNDNAPNCAKKITNLELRVGQKGGQKIGRIEAEDGDEGQNGAIRFRMQQPNIGIFQMAANGDIFLMEDLNDELELAKIIRKMNSFLVIAEDQPTNSAPLSTICQVNVQNGNNNWTKIGEEETEIINGQMEEEEEERIIWVENGMEIGTELMRMNSSNGIGTKWHLEGQNEYFLISPEGKLVLSKKIEEGEEDIIDGTKLSIRMEDGEGRNSKIFKFRVKLKDERILVIKIPTNWTIHSKKAIYQMENYSKLEYFYRNEGDDEKAEKIMDNGLIELDELSGELFIGDWPSSNESSISLRITAHPWNDDFVEIGHKNEQRIRLEMGEWIEKRMEIKMRPKCEKLFDQWNISESTAIGNFIGQVNEGIGDELIHFELAKEGNNDELFGIDEKSGKIYIKGKLNWMKAKWHILIIKISKNGGKRWTTKCIRQINIIQNDQIKSPKFLSRPNVTIFMANFEKGLYTDRGNIFHYFVVDKRPNEFKIVGSSKMDVLPFQIDPKNGALSILANVPAHIPSNISSIQLTVRASISESNFGEQNFTIYFDHFGRRQFAYFDRPQFWAELKMNGGKQFAANFGRKDGPENVEFLLFPSLPGFFFEDFGNLFYSPPPNDQQKIQQNLTIIVIVRPKNSSQLFDHSQLNISPIQRGIGPKIEATSCGNLSIPEGMKIDNLLRIRLLGEKLAKEGEESSSTIVFGIEGGNWHSLFSIHPKSGWLSCRQLDREARAEHLLMISATDFGTSPRKADVCSVRIEVIDRNDNSPKLIGIAEKLELPIEAKIGHILGKIEAEDGDEGKNGEIIFELENDPSGIFDLEPETGELSFERETAYLREHSGVWINIRAMDKGRPKPLSSEMKRIRIEWEKRKNEGKLNLAFSRRKYVAQIWEGMPKGQMVIKLDLVNLNEEKGNFPLSLSIVSGNLDSAFQIDESAKLWTNLELDAEIRPFYSLQILAFSGNGQRAECRVDIRVMDKEDNWPTIRRQNGPIKLNENTPIGTQIARIGANDVDSDWVEYSIMDGNEEKYFEIGRWTGRIHLVKELDFEAKRRHELQIEASDGIHHCSMTNLSIEILDSNDNAPKFMNSFLEMELPKNAQIGTLLAKLEAKDGDGTKMNRQIKFELVGTGDNGNDETNLLALDRNTGELRLRRKPPIIKDGNFDEFEQQFLTVKAIDSGHPPLFSFCTIRIGPIIADSNIHNKIVPTFSSPTFTFSSSAEHLPPKMPIGQLHLLHPPRLPLNCDFGLHFPANSSSNPFRIDFDGTIFLDGILEPEMRGQWIDLEATISGCPPPLMKSTNGAKASVRIKIVDENEKWPEFELGNWTEQILIGQNTEKGKLLAKMNNKISLSENSKRIYQILAGNDFGMFKMDGEKGELNFGQWNDEFGREMGTKMSGNNSIELAKTQIELVICQMNLEYPERKTVKLLKIFVENETISKYLNENIPTFGVPIYRKFVEENTPPGTILFTVKIAEKGNKKDKWKYSIDEIGAEWNETISMDPSSGRIILTAPLDLEGSQNIENPIKFNAIAKNGQGTFEAKVPAEIYLIGVDEFAPKFTKNAYTFQLSQNPQIGQQFGQILATDEDIGIGNGIKYSLDPADLIAAHFVSIDPSNGSLALIRIPPTKDGGGNGSEANVIRFTVWAQSMQIPMKRTNAIVFVEIVSPNSFPPQIGSSPSTHQFIPLLLLPFLLLLICCLSALLIAKLFLRAQNLPNKSQLDADFLRPTPKKRVFTVSACRQIQLEQQRQLGMDGIICRGFSPSFESGQFSQQNNAIGGTKSTNYVNIVDSSVNNNPPMPSGGSRRSQPDSGIDPDRISKGSEQSDGIGLANEYLQKLGIKERNDQPEDASFLDELIYAPLEEIFGPDESNGEMWRRRKGMEKHEKGLGQPILICGEKRPKSTEMIIPFKPLSQVLSQMEEEAKRIAERDDGSRV